MQGINLIKIVIIIIHATTASCPKQMTSEEIEIAFSNIIVANLPGMKDSGYVGAREYNEDAFQIL